MPNGVSQPYQLEESFPFRETGWGDGAPDLFLQSFFNLSSISCKQTIKHGQTPHFVASDLGLHCLPMPHKKYGLSYSPCRRSAYS